MIVPQIIYDSRRPEKWPDLMQEIYNQGITEWKIWEPVEDKDSVITSINKSHKRIVQWAKFNNLPFVAIWEDDCFFPAKDGWKKFIEQMPPWKWDIWSAGTYGLDRPITGKTDKLNGIHCYMVNERFYDTFLSVPDNLHIDVALDGLGLYYVSYPFIALQRPGWSSNSRAFSDKNSDLSKEDIYFG